MIILLVLSVFGLNYGSLIFFSITRALDNHKKISSAVNDARLPSTLIENFWASISSKARLNLLSLTLEKRFHVECNMDESFFGKR